MKPGGELRRFLAQLDASPVETLPAFSWLRDPLAPLALLPLATRDDPLGATARAVLARRMLRASADDLAGLERAARSTATLAALGMPADPVPLAAVARLAALGAESTAVLGVTSCLRDGYVREAATRALIARDDLAALPFVLLRLGDTVPSIARRADEAVTARWASLSAGEVVAMLPYAEALARRTRAGGAAARDGLRARMERDDPAITDALEAGLRAEDPAVRAAAASWLSQRDGAAEDAQARALLAALDDRDAGNRQRALRLLSRRQAVPESVLARVLPRLSRDRAPRVRARAAACWARTRDPDAALKSLCLDPSAAVRLSARVALHGLGAAVDVREMAREALRDDRPTTRLLGALGVVSDVGVADDAPFAARWVHDPRVRVRAAALEALTAVAPTLYADVALDAMSGTVARVARAAAGLVARCAGVVDPRAVLAAWRAGRVARGAWGALREAVASLDLADAIAAVVEGDAAPTPRGFPADALRADLCARVLREARMGMAPSPRVLAALTDAGEAPTWRDDVVALRRALAR